MTEQTPESRFGFSNEEDGELSKYPEERFIARLINSFDSLSGAQRGYAVHMCRFLVSNFTPLRGIMEIYELQHLCNILKASAEGAKAVNLEDASPQVKGKRVKDFSNLTGIHAVIKMLARDLHEKYPKCVDVRKWME